MSAPGRIVASTIIAYKAFEEWLVVARLKGDGKTGSKNLLQRESLCCLTVEVNVKL